MPAAWAARKSLSRLDADTGEFHEGCGGQQRRLGRRLNGADILAKSGAGGAKLLLSGFG